MEITEVRLRLVRDPGKLKAAASITIDDCFVVHDLRVVENEGNLFIAMPNKRIGRPLRISFVSVIISRRHDKSKRFYMLINKLPARASPADSRGRQKKFICYNPYIPS